jgi:hypothetical protein
MEGNFVFVDETFFPLDSDDVDPGVANFLFTTEIHTSFEYHPGQEFGFQGDDDVWIFVDGKLVLRLKHEPTEALLAQLNDEFADILVAGAIEKVPPSAREIADDDHVDLFRVRLHFDRRHLGRLRLLVDRLNAAAEEVGGAATP